MRAGLTPNSCSRSAARALARSSRWFLAKIALSCASSFVNTGSGMSRWRARLCLVGTWRPACTTLARLASSDALTLLAARSWPSASAWPAACSVVVLVSQSLHVCMQEQAMLESVCMHHVYNTHHHCSTVRVHSACREPCPHENNGCMDSATSIEDSGGAVLTCSSATERR